MRPNLTVVTLGVRNFKRALKFYKDGLGWSASVKEDVAFFKLGGVVLALYPRKLLADDAHIPQQGRGFAGFTLAHNARSKKEVDQIFKQVRKSGRL